mmetsp:Transcript_1812/g.2935  ORF Transcript_1812/g.2935 Transcript_1812/m.2935 type:complete len:102 (-) Transcript_1812:25-330(-)
MGKQGRLCSGSSCISGCRGCNKKPPEGGSRRIEFLWGKLGGEKSLLMLRCAYAEGFVSKEDFASALRGYQAAVDAIKSPQREEAEVALRQLREAAEKDRVK